MKTIDVPIVIENKEYLPQFESEKAAGIDLKANSYAIPSLDWDNKRLDSFDFSEDGFNLMPMERVLIKTGIKMAIPVGVEGGVRPRSGLALFYGITVVNAPGTLDPDFRGEVGVILINLSNQPFNIKKGDRIGQLIFSNYEQVNWIVTDDLDKTDRGVGGFGHTGK